MTKKIRLKIDPIECIIGSIGFMENQAVLYFDIGANVGAWALDNITQHNVDKIISVEASPETYPKLLANCGDDRGIIPIQYAVTNHPHETIQFYHAHCDVLSTTNLAAFTNPESRFYQYCPVVPYDVKTITLDAMIQKYGVPDLIKIDVESAEFECLCSLSQPVKLLCFEWAAETKDITFRCLQYLHDVLGYRRFFIQFRDNYIFRPTDTDYVDYETVCDQMSKIERTSLKENDWGMIWTKIEGA